MLYALRESGVSRVLKHRGNRDRENTNLCVPDNIEEGDDIRPTGQILQNLDLALNLLLLDGLQHLDDAFLVVDNVDALKDFRVFTPACPPNTNPVSKLFRSTDQAIPTAHGASNPWLGVIFDIVGGWAARTNLANDFVILKNPPA